NVRFGCDEVEETRHRGDAVNHPLVHADVNDLGAVLDLLPRDGQRRLVIAGLDELGEFWRPGHVGAFANVQEIGIRPDRYGVQAAQTQIRFDRGDLVRGQTAHGGGNGLDVCGRGAAAAADNVQPAIL